MKFVNARAALLFALFIGLAAAVTVITHAGSAHVDPPAAAQPVRMSIPF